MRPTITIALRDRITDIVETRTPDAKEMSFEEKAMYLKLIMQNFKTRFKGISSEHPNFETFRAKRGFDEGYQGFQSYLENEGLFKEFDKLNALLDETDKEAA